MRSSATYLLAHALLRAWRRHPLRAAAAMVGVILGTALATLVTAINDSVSRAASSANATTAIHADLAVQASTTAGLSDSIARRIRQAARGADILGVQQVNSRLVRGGRLGEALSILGVEGNTSAFIPTVLPTAAQGLAPPPGIDTGLLVGKPWLRRNHYKLGDTIDLITPAGVMTWTISGTIGISLPNNGAIAVGTMNTMRTVFGRRATDTFYIRTGPRIDRRALVGRLRRAVAGTALVGGPDVVNQISSRSLLVIQAMLIVAAGFGLVSAAIVVFVCWRLLFEDERANIARFRFIGATPFQLGNGVGAVTLAATAMCCALGIPLGMLASWLVRSLSSQLVGITGLAVAPSALDVSRPALAGLGSAVLLGGLAWVTGVRTFVRIPAIEAVAPPDAKSSVPKPRSAPAALGVLALALAVAVAVLLPLRVSAAGAALTVVGIVVLATAVPVLVGRAVASRGKSFRALVAGRYLAGGDRRVTAIVAMVGLSIAVGVTLNGVCESYRSAIERSVRSWTGADLFVRLGRPGQTLRDARFSPQAEQRLAGLAHVSSAGAFTYSVMSYRSRSIWLEGYDAGFYRTTDLKVYEGAHGAALWSALTRGEVAVSSGMARLDSLRVGSAITLPGWSAQRTLRVATIFDEDTSEAGAVVASMPTFTQLTGERRLEDIVVSVDRRASTPVVTAEIKRALRQFPSLTVLSGPEFRTTITSFTGRILTLFRGLSLAAFVIVLLAAILVISGSVMIRQRAIAVARVCGMPYREVQDQLCIEAAAMSIAGWILAALTSVLMTVNVLHMMANKTGLLPPMALPAGELAIALPLGVAVSLGATLVVIRMTLRNDSLVDLLRFE